MSPTATTTRPAAPDSGSGRRRRPEQPPPLERIGALRWLHQNLFSSPFNTALTLVALLALAVAVPPLLEWAILEAVWHAPDPARCQTARGACWAVVAEKHRVMLFGLYPYDQHWRPLLAMGVFVVAMALTAWRRTWSWWVALPLWAATSTVVVVLLLGGRFGLPEVNTRQWGGVPLTMVVFTWTVATALPLGILFALGRRSGLPVIRLACTVFIEAVRGVPLVTVLFTAAIIFPLFTPQGWDVDVLLRVLIGMSLYYAAYFAEVVRGGLQAIPAGQYEASASLGLSYWRMMRTIVLPQALRLVIPGLVNYVVVIFKNSTYVVVVGLFDLLNATRAALSDPLWLRYHTEAYLFVALFYFLGAWLLSLLGQHVERSAAQESRS